MRKIIYLIAIAVLFTFPVNAQQEKEWTLEECIEQALDKNISLKRQHLGTEIAKKDLNQSKLNTLPNLNGQVSHKIGWGQVLDEGAYEYLPSVSQGNAGIGSDMTLFGGLRGYNAIQRAKANYLMSLEDLKSMENTLSLEVMTGYLDLLLQEELLQISEEKVKVVEMEVQRVSKLFEVGNSSEGDLLQARSVALKEKYNRTLAKNNFDVARLSLVHLLNLESTEGFSIEHPVIETPDMIEIPFLDTVYSNAVNFLPEIKGAEYNISVSEKDLAIARGALSPVVFTNAVYSSWYSDALPNPFPQQLDENRYTQISLGLRIPVFNNWQSRTNISKAKIGLQDAQYNLENTKQQLLKNIQKYHTDVRAALDNYIAAQEAFVYSEEAYRYADERYKVGMATALELEEARNKMFNAQSEMISAKYVFVFYSKILDFYQGKGII